MKTRLVVNTSTKIPAWRQPAAKTESILNQVKKLTRELHVLQNELYRELGEEDGSRRRQSPLSAAPARDDLMVLKTAADQLRRVLWFYLQDSSNASDPVASSEILELSEPLVLQEPFAQAGASNLSSSAPSSFFERLNLVIDGYMQDRGISTRNKTPKS
jgi:hypothetical protein